VETTVIVLIVVIVLLVVALAIAGFAVARRRRSLQLQDHYGPEYERTLAETGDRRAAEAQLAEREKRHNQLDVRDLSAEERDRFAASWTTIQQGFVDDPVRSVHAADALVDDIMRTRGYPVDEDFERKAEDVSVEHPTIVARYREAREVRQATESGVADTEQQRHAVTSYRALIEALLGSETDAAEPQTNGHHARTTTEEHTR
jgi:FtsZ-interacting cell division protein ZipA